MTDRLIWARATALAVSLCVAGGAVAQPSLDGLAVTVERDGKLFVCSVAQGDGVAVTDACLPLVTRDEADRMAELAAEVAALTAAVAEADAKAAAADERAAGAEAGAKAAAGRVAAAQEELAGVAAARDAAVAERDALAGELDALRYQAGLRPLVLRLEEQAAQLARVDDARISVLARLSLLTLAEAFGDGCTIPRAAFTENEREAEALTIAAVLDETAIDADVAEIMIANLHPEDTDPDLAHNRLKAALTDNMGDADTWSRGVEALNVARRNLNGLGDRIAAKLQDGTLARLTPDQQGVQIITPPCPPG